MKQIHFISFFCLPLIIASCSNDNDFNRDVPFTAEIELTRAESEVNSSLNKVAFDIAKLLVSDPKASKNDNIAVSPISVEIALALVANSVDHESADEIIRTLQFNDVSDLNSTCNKLIRYLSNPAGNNKFVTANSVWINQWFGIPEDNWKTNLENNYYAQIDAFDFSVSKNVSLINNFVFDKTSGLISEILDGVDPGMAAYFVNALYFSGQWETPFPKKNTEMKVFSGMIADTTVPMMHKSELMKYVKTDSAEIVKLPMKGEADAYFLLPTKGLSTPDLLNELTIESWNEICSQMSLAEINLTLPRFKSESSSDISQVLAELGVPANVKLSAMGLDVPCSLMANHKVCTEIDETGAKTGAATIIGGEIAVGPMETVELQFNRPFVYLFQNRKTGTIITIGSINSL